MDRNQLIFDRTQANIDNVLNLIAANLPIPMNDLKISWDWRALNRIEAFTRYLADLLNTYGYAVSISTKTDWNTASIGTGTSGLVAEGNRIIGNIKILRDTFHTFPDTPNLPPNTISLTFNQANDIEKIIFDLDQLIHNMANNINLGWALGIAHIGLFGGTA